MAKITYTDKEALNEIPSIPAKNKVQASDMNEIKNAVNQNELKVLLIADSSAPAECSTGDMYYNTTTKLIYTATGTNTWGSTGVNPTENTLYIDSTNKSTYFYDGSGLISVGGGAGGESLKIGTIVPFAGSTAPSGYLMCNGQAVSRTTYADLFKAIGTSFGAGDGVTTFNVPNFNGRVPVGLDGTDTDFDTIGKTGGSKELQEHIHNILLVKSRGVPLYEGEGGAGGPSGYNGDNAGTMINTNAVKPAGTGNSGNLQPYIVTNFIIKASKKVALDKGNVVDSLDGSDTDSAPSVRAVNENMIKCKTVTFNPTWNVSTASGGYFAVSIPTKTTANLTNDDTILSAYVTPVGTTADYLNFVQEFSTDFSAFGMYCSGQAQIILTVFYI